MDRKTIRTSVLAVAACLLVLVLAVSGVAGSAFAGDRVPRMEITELAAMLDSPDVTIIDVRRNKDWEGHEAMIKNAVRRGYDDVTNWSADLPKDRKLVLYCA